MCIALLVLPYTINATTQSLETLPEELRLLGPSLGMTSWQSLRRILLPAAARGIFGASSCPWAAPPRTRPSSS